jgi:YesN/AraC family two-component response regulator
MNYREELKEFLSNKKIMFVDDDEVILDTMGTLLGRYTDDLFLMPNAMDAFEEYKKGGFDLVITDVSMPYKNGIELAKDILEIDQNAKIVFVTGHSEDSYKNAIEELGCKHLIKPVNIRSLHESLKGVF